MSEFTCPNCKAQAVVRVEDSSLVTGATCACGSKMTRTSDTSEHELSFSRYSADLWRGRCTCGWEQICAPEEAKLEPALEWLETRWTQHVRTSTEPA